MKNPEHVDTAGIAEMLSMSRREVTDRLVKRTGFPAPVVNTGPKMKRWNKRDVERWAAGRQRSRD